MSAITKKRIELFIKNPLENGLTRGEQMELARIALASLQSVAAPVVPDEMPEPDTARMFFTDAVVAIAKVQGWNACRAAMIHRSEPETDNTNHQFESLAKSK